MQTLTMIAGATPPAHTMCPMGIKDGNQMVLLRYVHTVMSVASTTVY